MQIERTDYEHGTEIVIGNEKSPVAYTVICSDCGRDKDRRPIPPTVNVYLPKTKTLDFESVRRLARELDYVADVAEALQAEKRAAYQKRLA